MVRLAHEPHVAEAEVAQAAVNQLGGGAGSRPGEVSLVDERDLETVGRRRLRDSRTDDSAADHEQIELPRGESFERGYAVHSGFVQARRPVGSATSSRP